MPNIGVEICCGSADGVTEAYQAGARRVELNSCLFLGGLTPSIGTRQAARKNDLAIMAMVRPREGGFCYSEMEFETMLLDARALLDAGADGIVFGFLNEDGTVNRVRCKAMLDIIGQKQSVFHRAIDVVSDWQPALDELIGLGVTRVLTSGQAPGVPEGAGVIREMIAHANNRIEILPGGGITAANLDEVVRQTGCKQIHLAMEKVCFDNSTTGNPAIHYGGALYPPENLFSTTDRAGVQSILQRVMSTPAPH